MVDLDICWTKKSKKGDEKLLGMWWFVFIGVVVGGISIGTFMFYGGSINVNSVESDILYNRIMDCMVENGFLKKSFIKKDFENIYEKCEIDKSFFNSKGAVYYLEINLTNRSIYGKNQGSIYDVANLSSKRKSLGKQCLIRKKAVKGNAEKYPRCVLVNESVLYYENGEIREGFLSTMVVSDNSGSKIKLGENV